MIHEIAITNFYSIRDRTVLDFRIAKNAPNLGRFRKPLASLETRVPTVIALFGPNAAGKSTILRALTSTVSFVLNSFDWGVNDPIHGFHTFMHNDWMTQPTTISVEFDAAWLTTEVEPTRHLFRYELDLEFVGDNTASQRNLVRREALMYYPFGKRRRLFERRKDAAKIYLAKEFGIRPGDARLSSIRPNSSVISTLAKLNNDLAKAIWQDLAYMQSNLWGLKRTNLETLSVLRHYSDQAPLLENLNKELNRIDVGIQKMELNESKSGLFAWFRHDGLEAPILLEEESSGTRHFVYLFPVLFFVISTGHVALIDEFDADLHPDLIRELVGWFQSPEKNKLNAQLLFTAHNASILEFLEKEEVFLVEKNSSGGTAAYGAQDVQGLRREVSLYNKYVGGSLGARPRIG